MKRYKVEIDHEKKEIRGIGGSPFGAFYLQKSYLYKQSGYRFFDENGNDVTDQCWEPGRMILDYDLKHERKGEKQLSDLVIREDGGKVTLADVIEELGRNPLTYTQVKEVQDYLINKHNLNKDEEE